MASYYCPKCGAMLGDKRKIPAHARKCGNRRFAIFR
jgi:hypothetical protein